MTTVHMTEAELARDVHGALEKVRNGIEIVIEQDLRPVVLLRPQRRSGRLITDIIQEARRRGSTVTLDEDFGADMESIIAEHQKPWNPPSWD